MQLPAQSQIFSRTASNQRTRSRYPGLEASDNVLPHDATATPRPILENPGYRQRLIYTFENLR